MFCSINRNGRARYRAPNRTMEMVIMKSVWIASMVLVAMATASCSDSAGPSASNSETSPSGANSSVKLDWAGVDRALGRQGTEQAGGVYRYGFPRADLAVSLDGVAIRPALALGSWAAFEAVGDQVMIMGDLVLTHDEVNPVMSRLLDGGFSITALHNHLLRSTPATMYMHISAHGDPVKLAAALRRALEVSRTPMTPPSAGAGAPPRLDLNADALDQLMGAKSKVNGGVLQYSIPRAERLTDGDMEIPVAMGTANAINFQPTGGGKAAITGDLVLIAREVPDVLRTLRANNIEVTALHNHMLSDEPRLFYLHFWANADAQTLARGLRSALNQMNIKRD